MDGAGGIPNIPASESGLGIRRICLACGTVGFAAIYRRVLVERVDFRAEFPVKGVSLRYSAILAVGRVELAGERNFSSRTSLSLPTHRSGRALTRWSA